jgi:UDP-N-acetyl-D-mannosaminuronic acid dehydrogenase
VAQRFHDPVVALLGLAYKPNVDDQRESPAIEIARELAARRVVRLKIVEPYLKDLPCTLANHPNVELTELAPAIKAADVVAILVAHNKFRALDRAALASKVVIDTVGFLTVLDEA